MTLASEFSPGATPLAMPRRRRHNARKKQCGPPLLLFCLSMAIIISRIGLASGMDNIDIPTADTAIRLLSEDIDSGGDQTAADIIQFDEANNAKSEVEEEKGLEFADIPETNQMNQGGESVVEQVSVAEKSKTEWPDDDDDVASHDEKESVAQVSVVEKENTSPQWPDDDDAAENDAASQIDSKMINEGTENTNPKSESEIDLDAENGDSSTSVIEGNVLGEAKGAMNASARSLMADRWVDESAKEHADDATWVLTSAFIILTMQSGFGLLEMGSSSRGFEVNIMTKNAMDVVFGALTYWFVGYGLSYGEPSNPFMGMGGE